ncbi:MAG: hypothetical protein O2856_04655 [Planctomycetota bacterium]|nr:hypothetical protein [Planctomycetota bacterium]
MRCVRLLTIASAWMALFMSDMGHADPPTKDSTDLQRPESLTVGVGDLVIRIDGPKMWTLSGIDFQKTVMAVEDSAYGAVFTIRDVGTLGSAHFLDVPNKPGEVEKENVTRLQFFLDDQLVTDLAPKMSINGMSFRMERRSQVRSIDIESSVSLSNGVLIESARVRTDVAVDLRIAAAMMYAWTPTATAYLFGDDQGIRNRGTFLPDTAKVAEGGDKAARWMAVYDALSGKGAVSYVVKQPPGADTWLQFTDAPKVYRKMRLLFFPEQMMPAGFDGTFQTATGFFSATESEWEPRAQQLATELKSLAETLNQQ